MLREAWGTGRERNRRKILALKNRGRGTQIFLAAYVRATRPPKFFLRLTSGPPVPASILTNPFYARLDEKTLQDFVRISFYRVGGN